MTSETKFVSHELPGGSQFLVPSHYTPMSFLGFGASGFVVACTDADRNNEVVAIKRVTNALSNLKTALRCLREVKALRHCRGHPHIINLLNLYAIDNQDQTVDIYMVLEHMDTDLQRAIDSSMHFSEEHCKYFQFQMMCGLKFVHSAGLLHRDLKPGNILISDDCTVKICDFGLAREYHEIDSKLTQYVVTRWYRAPEVLCSDVYDEKIDIWSLGCIFAELLTRRPLFTGRDAVHQIQVIVDVLGTPSPEDVEHMTKSDAKAFILRMDKPRADFKELFPNLSDDCRDLLSKMLQINPAKRISVDEALAHPYLKKYWTVDIPVCSSKLDLSFDGCDMDQVQAELYAQTQYYSHVVKRRREKFLRKQQRAQQEKNNDIKHGEAGECTMQQDDSISMFEQNDNNSSTSTDNSNVNTTSTDNDVEMADC